ncbi:MAG: class I SAM-dependent methyltransferase [Sphingopyxis sp.]|nr:class I SAM-dependent methyltransferase [Sphingopyxis sp.]
MTTNAPFCFDDHQAHVARYLEGPPIFMPGYHASHDIAAAVLQQRLGPQPHLLVVGAGGGVELGRFALHLPDSRYTAIDPSAAMIELGRVVTQDVAPPDRIIWNQCDAIAAPPGPFDAATAFLCLVFVPDDGGRLEQLRAIRARLKPGAPFLMMHAASEAAAYERNIERFARHAAIRGADRASIEQVVEMNRNQIFVLSDTRERELLTEAGFRVDGLFFKGLWIHGWEATACA